MSNPQSAIRNQECLCNRFAAMTNSKSEMDNPQSAICNPQSRMSLQPFRRHDEFKI
jgi:hypothetical protein